MPIRVHCPNGCLLRMPADRAGKKLRCPCCKAVIALPSILESDVRSGKQIPLEAVLVDFSNATDQVATDQKTGQSCWPAEKGLDSAIMARDSSDLIQPDVPQILSPLQLRQIANETREQRQRLVDSFEPSSFRDQDAVVPDSDVVIRSSEPEFSSVGRRVPSDAWRERLQEANANRITLTKALATVVFLVGIINAGPAIFHWYQSWSSIASVSMPRWIYLQIFVAALHMVYAIFLFQVSDWSSLRAISVAMLVFAFGFGIVATALLIEGGHGAVSSFFSLPHLMVSKATIWTVSMLCLATLVAYISGKEASDWKRVEQLLVEILNKSA